MPVKIFFCYAHEDEAMLKKLKTQLRPLQRQGLINEFWYDREISAGTNWEQELVAHLNTSQVILLLVSPDFIDSDYCYSQEMQRAIERHERGEARVIPIILRHVHWQETPLSKLQALPTDANPVLGNKWHNLDEAFYNVVEGVRNAIKDLSQNPQLGNSRLRDFVSQEIAKGKSIPEVLKDCYPGLDDLFEEVIKAMSIRVSQEIAKGKSIPEVLKDCYPGLDNLFGEVIEVSQTERVALQAQIEKLLQEVAAVGDGDLRVQAEVTPDTIGVLADSFNYMIEELAKVVNRVRATSVQVTNATHRILDRSVDIAQVSDKQLTDISRSVEMLEETKKFIQIVSHNSQLNDGVTQEALNLAVASKQFLIQTVEGIMIIRKDAQGAVKKYKHKGESSKEIHEIVRSIESIADRTEKLALSPFNETGYSLNSICGLLERQGQMIKSIAHDANKQISASEAAVAMLNQVI